MTFTIRVTEPSTKRFVEWSSEDFYRLKAQAQKEHKAGAAVAIKNEEGNVLYRLPRVGNSKGARKKKA